jgi:sulfur transfer protein SufE
MQLLLIKTTISELEKKLENSIIYEKLIFLDSQIDYSKMNNFKQEKYKLKDCVVKTWLINNGDNDAFSESRLINGLILIIKYSDKKFDNIEELIKYYNLSYFYSNIRIESLKTMFYHLTKVS